jgi:hypothetical protein
MKACAKAGVLVIVGLLWVAFASPLRADDPIGSGLGSCIYSNSINDLVVRFNPGTRQVGDQIVLGSTERYLTYFDFEYWGWNTANPSSFAGTIEARVQFYKNNGMPFNGYATPSDPFYDSGWFGGFGPTGPTPGYRATIYFMEGVDFPNGGLFIPVDEMTWSVQFRGMGASDTVGVDLYSPPVTGQNYPDYWENIGSEAVPNWILLTNTVAMDFGARMYANATIPEPSSLVLALAGGLGILTLVRRLRRPN